MKILLAHDGSPGADAALDDLGRAGLPPACEVRVLTVAHDLVHGPLAAVGLLAAADAPTDEPPTETRAAQALASAQHVADAAAARLAERFPHWSVAAEACGGTPASAVIFAADVWEPDLLVLGSRGRARPARLALGSVARQIVTHARCSVRVGRATPDGGGAARVLVGHDGTDGGRSALAAAASRAWPAGTQIRVVTVADPEGHTVFSVVEPWMPTWPVPERKSDRSALRRAVEDDVEDACRSGFEVSLSVESGTPASALVRVARTWRADSIFVGATGRAGVARFLLGSVSAAVADRARCSVEVVRS